MGHRVSPRHPIHREIQEEIIKYCDCKDDELKEYFEQKEQNKQNERKEKMETRSAMRKRDRAENQLYPDLPFQEENGWYCECCHLKIRPTERKGTLSSRGNSKGRLDSEQRSSNNFGLVFAFILILVSMIWFGANQWILPGKIAATWSRSTTRPTVDTFNQNLNAIKDADNSVNKEIWPAIISSARMVLKRDPSRTPAVIALIAMKDAFEEASQIARKFSKAMASIYDDDGIVEIHGDREQDVIEIHRKINRDLGKQNAHAVIIYDFNKMSNDTAMSFHGFFDDENAPFKEAFFTLVIRSEMIDDDDIDLDNVDATSSWAGTVTKDKLASLESRIRTKVFIRKTK